MTGRLCVLLALLLYLTYAECAVTREQMEKSGEMIRSVCQPRTKITTEMADGIREGKFPDDKILKCYIHCAFELGGIMKKNKMNYDAAMKQVEKLLPPDLLEETRNALTPCKDVAAGIKDACEAGYTIIQCMYKYADPEKFIFP